MISHTSPSPLPIFTDMQKRESERLTLSVPTTSELAQITLQQLASRMTLSPDVTVDLIQKAIENRWSYGERQTRGVYVSHDMVDYLVHEATLRETAGGKLDKELGTL